MKTLLALLLLASNAFAATEFTSYTPEIQAIQSRMHSRHAQLSGYYANGAIGLSIDGLIELHDPGSVPLAARQTVSALIITENQDREALYAEIANANGHPEWQPEVRHVFAQRWRNHAQRGWWLMSDKGWVQK